MIECKTSISDFRADLRKFSHWEKEEHYEAGQHWTSTYRRTRMSDAEAIKSGYTLVKDLSMGDFRFYFCLPGVITEAQVIESAPDHGLLYWEGRKISMVRKAPRRPRQDVHYEAEVRYLRFAIINGKSPYESVDSAAQLDLIPSPNDPGV